MSLQCLLLEDGDISSSSQKWQKQVVTVALSMNHWMWDSDCLLPMDRVTHKLVGRLIYIVPGALSS